ncbi:unnamed protein product [Cylicostephanus goldi]|uniref:Uncharacterized protein n=1 Tax=Cylicostephanus goldi TaxID=71465 RepID=A0A3P6QEG4_CYLGO|nr:unnamed protein product [Cylicostephanus goldi]
MSYLMIMYYCVAGISAVFFVYSLYLIFKVSTPQMVPYIYYLLTIQVTKEEEKVGIAQDLFEAFTFLESIYWTVLMAPIIKLPIFGIELGGLIWMLFKLPSQYIFLNSTLIFDDSFVTSGGPTTLLWLAFLLVGSTTAVVGITIIIKHVSIILKDQAKFSQTSRDMHRNAITGLIIQVSGKRKAILLGGSGRLRL